jgi:predicted RNA-binding protein with RPS1 domain
VKQVKSFGGFIHCEGEDGLRFEGLVHVSQIKDEGRVRDAGDVLRVDDKIHVKVIEVKEMKGRTCVSLSMKDID